MAEMEASELHFGEFHPEAVPSEIKSLKMKFRRQAELATRLKELRTQLAEAKATDDANVASLKDKLAQHESETAKHLDLLEMQKTAPAFRGGPPIWMGPSKIYT